MTGMIWILGAAAAAFALAAAVLTVKLVLMKRDLNALGDALDQWLSTDTNILLSTSSRDRTVRRLTRKLNGQLRQLRIQRRKYLNGDAELKAAVTNISHDLRTPLTAICGYLDLLEQEEQSPAARRYAAVIRERSEAMKQLTEELFRYSVILAAEGELKREPVAVGDVLAETVASFYIGLCQRGIEPEIEMPEEKVVRDLDRAALGRVFSNLLSNAVKYSDGDLSIALSADGRVRFSNRASGLTQVQVGRLFDRFYTVEDARKSTGLGLSIARTLVEQMGGDISAAYEDGRLTITLQL